MWSDSVHCLPPHLCLPSQLYPGLHVAQEPIAGAGTQGPRKELPALMISLGKPLDVALRLWLQ